jgi:Alr-MurF fusion protein
VIRLAEFLAANPDAAVHGPVFAEEFAAFCFDSRLIQPGELFLAVKTAKADGHDYIDEACRGGAAGVICQRATDLASFGATCIVVPDTERAIQRFAAWLVRARGVRVAAITGSAGKTTTKEACAHVLSARYWVFRNPANFSGRFGLPIAIAGLSAEDELAIIEMATDHFGEMALLTQMAPPQVAAVTVVAAAHLSAFGDLDGVAREKGVLVEALPPDGLAILNADDPRVAAMAGRTAARVVTYAVDGPADYQAQEVSVGRAGTDFQLVVGDRRLPVHLPWLGVQFAQSALIAIAMADHYGLDLATIAARLATLPPVPGRLNPLPGRRGALILDDSYNASPAAVQAGLDVLATLPAERRIAVLGQMAELGPMAEEGHRRVGRRAAEIVDLLVVRGREATLIAEEARAAGLAPERIAVTYTAADAIAAVEPHLGPGTVVLAKGSAVARMEQVVAGLMAEPERARDLLVRQDAAWRQIVVIQPDRPTWLEIDHGAIAANSRRLKELAGDAALMVALKADGYGHGAVQVAHTTLQNGASWCGVACVPEGQVLRQAGIDAPTLVLGYTPAWQAREAIGLDLSITVFDLDTAQSLSRAAQAVERPARVHVKVDTGMHRLGLAPAEVPAFLTALRDLPGLQVEGLFTHLATADDLSTEGRVFTERQLASFARLVDRLVAEGLRPPLVHVANSAVLLTRPDARYDLVRPGIAFYGLGPSADVGSAELRPALAWKTQVAQVRELAAGDGLGYGHAWRAARGSRVATIPVGYADGFRRGPTTWAHVLVRGQAAPVVGRVSMDQSTIDVTDIPGVRQGDEVVLIGRQGDAAINVETVAGWLGTISYEVVAEILARVPRVT